MNRKYSLRTRLHRVSHSWLAAATACPLRGFWEGIVELRVPQSPPAVLGQALHYLFQQFFTAHRTTGRFPYKEEAKFWDTHDSIDYLGAFKPARLTFARRKPKVLVSVRLGKSELALMRRLASQKGLGYGSMLRMWLTERLLEEAPTIKQ